MTKLEEMHKSEEDVVIARIAKVRGIRGELVCTLETDFPERFDTQTTITAIALDGARHILTVEDHWFHQGRVILKFAGIDTPEEARKLTGYKIVISVSDAMRLEEGEYYEYDLVGLEVVTVDGQIVGRVTGLLRTGGTDLLVTAGEGGRENLIPFADEICIDVDIDAGRILINPPGGLLDV